MNTYFDRSNKPQISEEVRLRNALIDKLNENELLIRENRELRLKLSKLEGTPFYG
jgi:hypothetical protein